MFINDWHFNNQLIVLIASALNRANNQHNNPHLSFLVNICVRVTVIKLHKTIK